MILEGILPLITLNSDIVIWLNQYSQTSSDFNRLVNFVSSSPLTKGIPIMGLIWYFWFRDIDNGGKSRHVILSSLLGSFLALSIARVLNNVIIHLRPIAALSLHFKPLLGLQPIDQQDWFYQHSFPSDHATLFFSLATAIFLVSRRTGMIAIAYVSVIICLPRIYLGLHYPGDILAGAVLGTGCTLLLSSEPVRRLYEDQLDRLIKTYPAAFQAVLFMLSVEMCFLFDDVRHLLKGLFHFYG